MAIEAIEPKVSICSTLKQNWIEPVAPSEIASMPRLVVSLNSSYSAPQLTQATGSNGRRIRNVDALLGRKAPDVRSTVFDARFLKWTAGLALLAGAALSLAAWQLFHFPH